MTLRSLALAACFGALLAALPPAAGQAQAAATAAEWKEWPLPLPSGGRYRTPGGLPGDLSFFAPNRGLLTVGGNNSVPEGLWSWDGTQWHQLATVCGGGARARIAWAGPTEFWTISRPSLPRFPGEGIALCHFKDGAVVGSFSTVPNTDDSYRQLSAAACNGPDDCWFGGAAARAGSRSGGFHLHWDGASLQIVYSPQGRGVSDLLADGGRFFESSYVGSQAGAEASSAILRDPETTPSLLHRLAGGGFSNDPFMPRALAGVPAAGTELLALDGDGEQRWAVGGGAVFGPSAIPRGPLAARLIGDAWNELALTPAGAFAPDETFGDVAAIPGSGGAAWATVLPQSASGPGEAQAADEQPRVAHIAPDGAVRVVELAPPSPQKGAAVRIDCPAANDCWVATARGFLYRLASATALPLDTDPAFQGTITVRPNEAAEQSISDDPPEDDSLLLAPPVEAAPEAADSDAEPRTCRVPKLITKQQSKLHGAKRLRLVISFQLARRARIALTARRGGKVVARTKLKTLQKGKRSLTLNVSRKRYPTKLAFVIRNDAAAAACAAASR